MTDRDGDWLRVIYGAGVDRAAPVDVARREIRVRQSPTELDLDSASPQDHRIRVAVVPSRPGLAWSLYLCDLTERPTGSAGSRVWWRLEPGIWQPLRGVRPCVATGRGRVLLDVVVRVDREATDRPRLRFIAEPSA
jgi:hypothetical protein